jgi:16S rRNA (cytosine1402-N4)-methyltransferase
LIPVCAAVIFRSGAVLLCRRGPGRKHAGKWEFPGGRIEDGESAAAALKRELREELGIDAEIGPELARATHTYDFGAIELIALKVSKFTGELTLKDHDEVKWVEARRLLEYDLAAADVPIAETLASYKRRERYTGTHPKTFEQKYKELGGDASAAEKAKARGSTPAGTHIPIMAPEIVEALSPLAGAVVLDCTLGWGGHAEQLARRAKSVIALDRDGEELERTRRRLADLGLSITVRKSDYAKARAILAELKVPAVDALLADLGVSSMQLDRPDRGMSFKNDGPLDMRMDRSRGETAAQWLVRVTGEEVERALRLYGDEPDAAKIASLLKERLPGTTFALASAVTEAKGLGAGRFVKKDAFSAHPAVKTFQALRIAVNDERRSLETLLADLPSLIKPGGRLALLTFHSGEERLVEEALRFQKEEGRWASTAGPRKASPAEIALNPRARSARLWTAVRA